MINVFTAILILASMSVSAHKSFFEMDFFGNRTVKDTTNDDLNLGKKEMPANMAGKIGKDKLHVFKHRGSRIQIQPETKRKYI